MANPEHLEILKQGVDVWNEWRINNKEIKPDLKSVNFRGSSLIGVDLRNANLGGAKLSGSDLSESNMSESILRFADLQNIYSNRGDFSNADMYSSDLSEAFLRSVKFFGADMTAVTLRQTSLFKTNLEFVKLNRANLMGTIFVSVKFNSTNFFQADMFLASFNRCSSLSKAKNLDQLFIEGNISIDNMTLRKCINHLPNKFLFGIGYTDDEIKYLRSMYSRSITYYSCFISYSHKDQEFTDTLVQKLRSENITVWFAPEDMKIGDKIRRRIDEEIRIYDKILIILSEDSIESQWVEQEVEKALERERKENKLILFPIRVDNSIFDSDAGWASYIKNTRNIGDFTKWKDHDEFKKAFDRLLKDLKKIKK